MNSDSGLSILFNSHGAGLFNALAFYDCLRFLTNAKTILSIGTVYSVAALILCGGTLGQRYSFRNCRFMLCQIEISSQGSARAIMNDVLELKRLYSIVQRIIVQRAGGAMHLDYPLYFGTNEAVVYGLVSNIIE